MTSRQPDRVRQITAVVRDVAVIAAGQSDYVQMPPTEVSERSWNAARGHIVGGAPQAHELLRQYNRLTHTHRTWRGLLVISCSDERPQ